MTTPAIHVDRVVKRYGNHVAVREVSFTVPRGVIYGVLGPNGAGKSTTLRMINDILVPDAGAITLFGNLKPGSQAAARIGYLPEERGLYPKMKVFDMVRFMGELRGLSGREAKVRAGAWLERLGLNQWADNKVADLSKGMQQKVQFATALIHEPELVILDEPWSGLDPINAEVLHKVVEDVRAEGRTVLFSTHQMEQAEKICDHVCIIARGQVVLDGRLTEVKRAAAPDDWLHVEFVADADRGRALDGPLAPGAGLIVSARPRGPERPLELDLMLPPGGDAQVVLRALVEAQVGLRGFAQMTPSLHQIFVDKVGAAEAAVAERNASNDRGAA